MGTGASLRAKKSASVRTGGFFTLRFARGNFGRAELGQNSANSAEFALRFDSMPICFAAEAAKLKRGLGARAGNFRGGKNFYRPEKPEAAGFSVPEARAYVQNVKKT